jgi:hypothetical protein
MKVKHHFGIADGYRLFGWQVPIQPIQVISFPQSVCCDCCLLQAYSSTLKFEALCSSEISVELRRKERGYIPKCRPQIEYSDIFFTDNL